LSLIEEAQFDWGFIFKYSTREGTPAAALEPFSQELIEERHQECLALVDRIAQEKRQKLLGSPQEVLIEENAFGRTRTNYKTQVTGNVLPGETVRVEVSNAQRTTLEGKVV
jgi:tRNA-2-methylthio-N6-dimethylallyladenosine synthase